MEYIDIDDRFLIIRRIILFIIAAIISFFGLLGCRVRYVEETTEETTTEEITQTTEENRSYSLRLWYCDESLKPYLEMCAGEYMAANKNVGISLLYIPEADYVDTLTEEALSSEAADLYIVDNDKLEQLRLAGIVEDNRMTDIYSVYNYSEKALDACTYKGRIIAYPLTFDTTFVLYNADIVGDNVLRTFDDIKNFADGYEVPIGSNISTIFSCDLDYIFFNYGYLGKYLDIGGKCGDDKTIVYNITDELTEAVKLYQSLIAFFFIDINAVNYYSCINGFADGSIVATVMDTGAWTGLDEMTDFEVGVLEFPDFTDTIGTSPLSVTTVVAVNPFSDNVSIAESFAKYITYTNAPKLYDTTGSMACRRLEYEDGRLDAIYASYDKSTPKLKMMYSDEFYALLEVSMHLMARGDDDVQALSAVSSYLESHWK